MSDRLAKRIPSVASGNIDGSPSAQKQQQEHSDWFADNDKITYSAFSDTPFWRSVDKSIFNTWRTILAGTGEKLIDVGCAQGRATFVFADLDLDILAFDVSRSLVCQAARRAHHERHRARISFFLADALKIPVSSAAFDGALVYGVLHHLPNPGEVCREIQRVMESGAADLATNRNELLTALCGALANPSDKQKERAELVKLECGELDGRAVERLAASMDEDRVQERKDA